MRALAAAAVTALLLTGCATEEDRVRALVEDITVEANERDADAVRSRVDDLLGELDAAVEAGDLTAAEAEAVRERALAVQAGADAIDADLLARRQAEQAAQEAQAELEAERAAAEAAEQARAKEQAKQDEEAANKAAEEAAKAAEEARKAEDEARKESDQEDEGEEGGG